MSSCMKYRVLSDDGYTISNGRLGSANESDMDIGSHENPPIVVKSYKGETTEEIYKIRFSEHVPKYAWNNLIKGKPTGNWMLTYITISPTSVSFDFGYLDHKKERCSITVHATEGMEIWLEVPRDDGLTPATYLIDAYYDRSLEDNYHIRVTEFYERMRRQISVENDIRHKVSHSKSAYDEYLLITEYRD